MCVCVHVMDQYAYSECFASTMPSTAHVFTCYYTTNVCLLVGEHVAFAQTCVCVCVCVCACVCVCVCVCVCEHMKYCGMQILHVCMCVCLE